MRPASRSTKRYFVSRWSGSSACPSSSIRRSRSRAAQSLIARNLPRRLARNAAFSSALCSTPKLDVAEPGVVVLYRYTCESTTPNTRRSPSTDRSRHLQHTTKSSYSRAVSSYARSNASDRREKTSGRAGVLSSVASCANGSFDFARYHIGTVTSVRL